MKAKEINKLLNTLWAEINDANDSFYAIYTLDFVQWIAEDYASRGADASDVVIELLDNNLIYDGKDEKECFNFYLEAKGLGKQYNFDDFKFDLENAKKLWAIEDMKLIIEG